MYIKAKGFHPLQKHKRTKRKKGLTEKEESHKWMGNTLEASGRTYERYDPHFEWAQEEGCDTLILMLPGFRKDQLRVQLTSKRILKINGERQIIGNLSSIFHKEFQIPSDCNTKKIRAKFEGGLLFIKLPKLPTSATRTPEEGAPRPKQPPTTATPPEEPGKEKVEEKNNADSEQSDIAKGKPIAEEYIADVVSHMKEKSTKSLDGKGETTTSGALEEDGTFGGLGKHEERIDKTEEEIAGLGEGYKKPKNLVNLIMAILLFLLFGMYVINAFVSS